MSVASESESSDCLWAEGGCKVSSCSRIIALTHTHPFNGPLSGTTRVSRYQKGKTNPDFTEARDSEWQWNPLGYMQVCTSLQTDNHASTTPLSFLQAGGPSCRPTNRVKALKTMTLPGSWTLNHHVPPFSITEQSENRNGGLKITRARVQQWAGIAKNSGAGVERLAGYHSGNSVVSGHGKIWWSGSTAPLNGNGAMSRGISCDRKFRCSPLSSHALIQGSKWQLKLATQETL